MPSWYWFHTGTLMAIEDYVKAKDDNVGWVSLECGRPYGEPYSSIQSWIDEVNRAVGLWRNQSVKALPYFNICEASQVVADQFKEEILEKTPAAPASTYLMNVTGKYGEFEIQQATKLIELGDGLFFDRLDMLASITRYGYDYRDYLNRLVNICHTKNKLIAFNNVPYQIPGADVYTWDVERRENGWLWWAKYPLTEAQPDLDSAFNILKPLSGGKPSAFAIWLQIAQPPMTDDEKKQYIKNIWLPKAQKWKMWPEWGQVRVPFYMTASIADVFVVASAPVAGVMFLSFPLKSKESAMMVSSSNIVYGLAGAVAGGVIGSIAGITYESTVRVDYVRRLVARLIRNDAGAGHVFTALWVMAGKDVVYGNYGPKEQETYSYYTTNIWNEANAKANPEAWFDVAWEWIKTV